MCGEVAWFLRGKVVWFFSLTHWSCMIYLSGGCMIFFRRDRVIFFAEVALFFLWRACILYCVIFFVERICDFVCWDVAWFCVCGEVVWFFSLTQIAWFIFLKVARFFLFGEVAWFFYWEIVRLFVWRGCMIFCVKRLRNFFVKKFFNE